MTSIKITEDMLQAQCVEWFKAQYPDKIIYAIPNGGSRNKIEAAKLKRCGVLPGVPDLCIPSVHTCAPRYKSINQELIYSSLVSQIRVGLYIELKAGKNKLTKNQEKIKLYLSRQGYEVCVCYTFEEFVKVVKEYFDDN